MSIGQVYARLRTALNQLPLQAVSAARQEMAEKCLDRLQQAAQGTREDSNLAVSLWNMRKVLESLERLEHKLIGIDEHVRSYLPKSVREPVPKAPTKRRLTERTRRRRREDRYRSNDKGFARTSFNTEIWDKAPRFCDLSLKARHLANALKTTGRTTILPGKVKIDHLAELQRFRMREICIVQNPTGDMKIFVGEERSSKIPLDLAKLGYRYLAHTHPEEEKPGSGSSSADDSSMATDLRNKRTSHTEIVISRGGSYTYFNSKGILELPNSVHLDDGPTNKRGYFMPIAGF